MNNRDIKNGHGEVFGSDSMSAMSSLSITKKGEKSVSGVMK
jgi:hypothetical protein